jgi:hypothetical protein
MGDKKPLIWVGRKADYFCCEDWTGQISLKCLANLDFSRISGSHIGRAIGWPAAAKIDLTDWRALSEAAGSLRSHVR